MQLKNFDYINLYSEINCVIVFINILIKNKI